MQYQRNEIMTGLLVIGTIAVSHFFWFCSAHRDVPAAHLRFISITRPELSRAAPVMRGS